MRRISLFVYNLLLIPVALLLLPGYLLRIRKRGGYGKKFWQRFGLFDFATLSRIGTGRIWLHAVSVGEAGIALKFAAGYRERNRDARFLISSTTSTGLAILQKQASDWLEPIANPIDFPFITSFLMRRLAPSAVVMIEADLWPNRIASAKAREIPVLLLNARISPRSEMRYRRFRGITAPLFNQLDLITLTDEGDPERWHAMGVRNSILRLTGNIKHDRGDKLVPQRSLEGNPPLFLAASTHGGEEEVIADAWRKARAIHPTLRLVIVPRHAERRNEARGSMLKHGVTCTLRSEGGDLSNTPLLLDTTGELSEWYHTATVVFVGKSLPSSVNKGGQNIIEPLQAGTPVLFGPHTSNFEPLASLLVAAGAATRVADSEELAEVLVRIINDPGTANKMVCSAEGVLSPHRGSVRRQCELVEEILSRRSPSQQFGR